MAGMYDKWIALACVLWPVAILFLVWAGLEAYLRRPRFSLYTLLVGMTVVAALLCLAIWAAN
jgi:hypothetical protein